MTKLLAFAFSLSLAAVAAAADPAAPVDCPIPTGLGVNIHFTDARAGEMEMLAAGGFEIIRMDFGWGGTEREKGKYDFSAYDRLMASLEKHKIRAVFILDYSNRLYDNDQSPSSDEGRQAFAAWAAAAVKHFQGRGIVWEMYNEPNIFFWRPKPNADDYTKLALAVGKAIREVGPKEIYIGPATSEVDLGFLEKCFQAGALEYWSAVSVHPYRQTAPETAAADYAKLRKLIAQYAPKGKSIPIISGEWGYSCAWDKFDDVKQGKYLPRQWLTNVSNNVPISIWYDWHDDGVDAKEPEHHFGTVRHEFFQGRERVYDPKPSYLAAKALTTALRGFTFSKRLAVGSSDDYVLLFAQGKDVRLVAWTTGENHATTIPASAGKFAITSYLGETLPALEADKQGLTITLSDAPQYLAPEGANELLQVAAAWQRAPLDMSVSGGQFAKLPLTIANPLAKPISVSIHGKKAELQPGKSAVLEAGAMILRTAEPTPMRIECKVEGLGTIVQETRAAVTNPLLIGLLPAKAGKFSLQIGNPSGGAVSGTITLTDVAGFSVQDKTMSVDLRQGETAKIVSFPMEGTISGKFTCGVVLRGQGGSMLAGIPAASYSLVDDFGSYTPETLAKAYPIFVDGDAKVASTQSLSLMAPSEGPPAPGVTAVKLAYEFAKGWKFVRVAAQGDALRKIEGTPRLLTMWVHGDGSGNLLRMRVVDATGQTFQASGTPVRWKGWQRVEIPISAATSGHWGGANDGVIHFPIRWDTLLLLDSASQQETKGEIYVAAPMMVE